MEMHRYTTESYWSDRYQKDDIPWDAGSVTTPIREYLDSLANRNIRILIPGAGSAWEAEYAFKSGFANVKVIDISSDALKRFKKRCPAFPGDHLIHGDFFAHNDEFDLILEQTFFCALPPEYRNAYVAKMLQLLKPGGLLAGVLFDDALNSDRPPFGGNEQIYRQIFFPAFDEIIMEPCYNSIPPRRGRELFICLRKPTDSHKL